jgi:hypothetical protein
LLSLVLLRLQVNVVTNNSLSRGDGTPHSCQPNEWGAEVARCGSRLARCSSGELSPTPGIPVGCSAAAVALTQTVGKLTAGLLVPMVTMTLSVRAVDGHIDTVDCCSIGDRWPR